ncbi:holo-ACP synthase [Candidatus Clostridium radicumherbarum]|uniref:Holo-[acyl-carrier-protein] synthase n=1 Tax=Candidatus Clostridium radicumherbarum TaxID=3381662 RepID=A0ABW8TTM8_9CLOT
MILGIGVDIVEIRRIKEAIERNDNFINKLFNKEEIEYLKLRGFRPEFVAGRFAAKEAVSKALGTGFRGFGFKDIVIDRTTLGKPIALLKGKAKEIAKKLGANGYKIDISISHGEDSAIAYVIIEECKVEDDDSENSNWANNEGN